MLQKDDISTAKFMWIPSKEGEYDVQLILKDGVNQQVEVAQKIVHVRNDGETSYDTPPLDSRHRSLWHNVLNYYGLHIVNPCMAVSGIVESIEPREDGDLYILLRLDDQYVDLTDAANEKYFQGNLVVNVVCQSLPSEDFADEKASRCGGAGQDVDIPVLGSHVVVT